MKQEELSKLLVTESHDVVLPFAVGQSAEGKMVVEDLAKIPHLLVGGETNDGAVDAFLKTFVAGLSRARTKDEVQFVLVDSPRKAFVEFENDLHLLMPVISKRSRAIFALKWAVEEVSRRLEIFASLGVRDIWDYNQREASKNVDGPKLLPYVVVIVAELADIVKEVGEDPCSEIIQLGIKGRAVGFHIVLGTQQPDSAVAHGAIKASIPGRIAFKVNSTTASCVLLEGPGAENLSDGSHCLYRDKSGFVKHLQVVRVA